MAFRWRGDDGPLLVVLKMAFRWRADDGPLLVVFESSSFSSTKQKEKRYRIWTPSDKTFRIRACNGPIASRGVSLKATRSFLGKPIATCDLPSGGGGRSRPHAPPYPWIRPCIPELNHMYIPMTLPTK